MHWSPVRQVQQWHGGSKKQHTPDGGDVTWNARPSARHPTQFIQTERQRMKSGENNSESPGFQESSKRGAVHQPERVALWALRACQGHAIGVFGGGKRCTHLVGLASAFLPCNSHKTHSMAHTKRTKAHAGGTDHTPCPEAPTPSSAPTPCGREANCKAPLRKGTELKCIVNALTVGSLSQSV